MKIQAKIKPKVNNHQQRPQLAKGGLKELTLSCSGQAHRDRILTSRVPFHNTSGLSRNCVNDLSRNGGKQHAKRWFLGHCGANFISFKFFLFLKVMCFNGCERGRGSIWACKPLFFCLVDEAGAKRLRIHYIWQHHTTFCAAGNKKFYQH